MGFESARITSVNSGCLPGSGQNGLRSFKKATQEEEEPDLLDNSDKEETEENKASQEERRE